MKNKIVIMRVVIRVSSMVCEYKIKKVKNLNNKKKVKNNILE